MNNTMPINTYLSTMEPQNKINEQVEQKESHRYRNILMVVR